MQDMTLREELKAVSGNKRHFILLRIADMDTAAARKLVGVTQGTYNSWLHNPEFAALYHRRAEFCGEYKLEAIQLLRRDNQLTAVLLESKLIRKMKEEVEKGEYELIRTNLAREVYSKLISDLDYQPQVANLSWEQKLQQIFMGQTNPQLGEGEVINAEVITETASEQEAEHPQSQLLTNSEQVNSQAQEET